MRQLVVACLILLAVPAAALLVVLVLWLHIRGVRQGMLQGPVFDRAWWTAAFMLVASEEGTYADGRAALAALLRQEGVDPRRVLYLGEPLGGAVAVALFGEGALNAGVVLEAVNLAAVWRSQRLRARR